MINKNIAYIYFHNMVAFMLKNIIISFEKSHFAYCGYEYSFVACV